MRKNLLICLILDLKDLKLGVYFYMMGDLRTDRNDNKVVVICKKSGVVKTFQQRDKPYGISRYSEHSIAITIPNLKESILIDLETAEQTEKLSFEHKCWGVISDGISITRYIRVYESGIQFVDGAGKLLKILPAEELIMHITYSDEKSYFTQNNPDLVKCCTIDGSVVW